MELKKIDSAREKNNLIILVLYCTDKRYSIISVIYFIIDIIIDYALIIKFKYFLQFYRLFYCN